VFKLEEPLENQKISKVNPRSNIVIFILLIAIIIGIAFFAYLKSQDINITNINIKDLAKNLFTDGQKTADKSMLEINFDINEHPVFSTYKEFIIKCTNNSVKWIDKKGNVQLAVQVSLNKPFLKSSGTYLLVADLGGKDIYVIAGKSIKWNKKVTGNIINADINDKGYVTTVQEGDGYKSVVQVFNQEGNESFTRTIAENNVLSAKVSSSGEQIVINKVDTSGIKINSYLEFNNISGDKPFANISLTANLFPSQWCLDDGAVFIANDKLAMYFDKVGKVRWEKKYANIYSTNVVSGKYSVIGVNEGNNKTNVIIFNSKGQKLSSYDPGESVINIETFSDIIAINTGKQIHFINTKGKLTGKYNSKSDIEMMFLFNKQEAAVVTHTAVELVRIE
jgi:hypothetical protein